MNSEANTLYDGIHTIKTLDNESDPAVFRVRQKASDRILVLLQMLC